MTVPALVRWPPVRFLRCLRCSRPFGSAPPVESPDWPGGWFCSEACRERMDEGFEAVEAALRARRTGRAGARMAPRRTTEADDA